jgi:hypothetical protein
MELAQIIHQKSYAAGASPFSKSAIDQYKLIRNINDPAVIPYLTSHGIDTILINNKLMKNAAAINERLSHDSRLLFVGRYSAPPDKGYVSTQDLSRDYSLYQIKKVVQENEYKLSLFSVDNTDSTVSYKKITPAKYVVSIHSPVPAEKLRFDLPFSEKWQLYSGDLSTQSDISFFFRKPVEAQHGPWKTYANQWTIRENLDASDGKGNQSIKNSDTSSDYTATIYFTPQAQMTFFVVVTKTTLLVLVVYLLLQLLYGKHKK